MKSLRGVLKNFFRRYFIYVLIVVIPLSFFWQYLIAGKVPFPSDFIVGVYKPWTSHVWGDYIAGVPVKNPILADVPSYIFPIQTYAQRLVKSGVLPLWNPYILGGAPLLADFQSAAFSPTAFVYLLVETIDAWSIQIILQHVLALLFTFILLRSWNVSKYGSLIGGVIFAFSGFNLIWSQWNGHALTAAFIPLILFFQDRFANSVKYLYGLGLSLSVCGQVLSGYPQIILYTVVASLLLWTIRIKRGNFFRDTVSLGVFYAFGFGIAGIQLIPGAELMKYSQWTKEINDYDWAFLPLSKTITFFVPDFFGNHATGNYWGPQDYTSNTGFVGVGASLFALRAILRRKRVEIIYAIILLITTLVLVYPTPISEFLWRHDIAGMASSSAHRGLVLFNLSVALLSGFGVDYYMKFTKAARSILSFVLVFAFCVIAATILGSGFWDNYLVAVRNLVFPLAIAFIISLLLVLGDIFNKYKKYVLVICFVFLTLELFRFGWKFNVFGERDFVFPEIPVTKFLSGQEGEYRVALSKVIPPNLHMNYQIETIEGYETIRPEISSKFLAVVNSGDPNASPTGRFGIVDGDSSRLLDLVNTRYYLVDSSDGLVPDRFDGGRFEIAARDGDLIVLESRSAIDRYWMYYNVDFLEDDLVLLSRLVEPEFDFSRKLLVRGKSSDYEVGESDWDVKVLEQEALDQKLLVRGERRGYLFSSETYYPGWNAYIDGELVELLQADYAFRAVEVPEGEHTVAFKYEPQSFKLGILVSFISFFCVLLVVGGPSLIGFIIKSDRVK